MSDKTTKTGSVPSIKELEKKLRKFYEIKYELEHTALQLKDYYKK